MYLFWALSACKAHIPLQLQVYGGGYLYVKFETPLSG